MHQDKALKEQNNLLSKKVIYTMKMMKLLHINSCHLKTECLFKVNFFIGVDIYRGMSIGFKK